MKYVLSAICSLVFFLAACKKEKPVPDNIPAGLSFEVDGKIYSATLSYGTSVSADDSSSIVIYGQQDNTLPAVLFGLVLYFSPQTLTHSFSDKNCDSVSFFVNTNQHVFQTGDAYHLVAAHIENYNASSRSLTGSFQGKLFEDSLSLLIPLNNGTFNIKIQ